MGVPAGALKCSHSRGCHARDTPIPRTAASTGARSRRGVVDLPNRSLASWMSARRSKEPSWLASSAAAPRGPSTLTSSHVTPGGSTTSRSVTHGPPPIRTASSRDGARSSRKTRLPESVVSANRTRRAALSGEATPGKIRSAVSRQGLGLMMPTDASLVLIANHKPGTGALTGDGANLGSSKSIRSSSGFSANSWPRTDESSGGSTLHDPK